jgi:SAM-dependent methyltransferase
MPDSRRAALTGSAYTASRRDHWDALARRMDTWSSQGKYYHRRLAEVYGHLIPAGERLLELGCGRGDLLAALKPRLGVGIDLSAEMVRRAAARHPALKFIQADAHALPVAGTFDAIILSDLVNDLWDVQTVLMEVVRLSTPSTRVFLNSYSRLWEGPLEITRRLGLSKPTLFENWLTVDDLNNLLRLSGLERIRSWPEILLPLALPVVAPLFNKVVVRVWPFGEMGMTNFFAARTIPAGASEMPSVSVIVPARNEAGNIAAIFNRVPGVGRGTQLVFVEGHSTDRTYEVIQQNLEQCRSEACLVLRQAGSGKGDAVRLGFSAATGDILMILDADLTVSPESLTRFYGALVDGCGEFINGVRLVYPMEDEAMRFFNLVGNRFFSVAFSWLLGQRVKDTLCGTKVLWRRDYERIAASRSYFGELDPFGDFDLLFGAARLNLKIVDMPVRYGQRTYGATNIQRWRHGWLLLRMLRLGFLRLKAV